MFNFQNLIGQYSSDIFIIRESEGYYNYENGGIWIPGKEEQIAIRGAVIPLSTRELNEQLQYGEGGAYTRGDRKVYTHESLELGEIIEHKELRYKVAEKVDYADLASGLSFYMVRRVT